MCINKYLSIIFMTMLLFAAGTHGVSANEEIILTTEDYAPYSIEGGDDAGAMSDLITAAFKEVGLTVKIKFYPWKRAENEVREGRAFGIFAARMTAERQQEFDFSDPLYSYSAKFFYNKKFHPDGMPYETFEDLRPYTLGGELGFWYEPLFKRIGLNVEYVATVDQNIQKLYSGRVDLLPEEENNAWFLIRQRYPDEVDLFGTLAKPLEEPGVINRMHLMVSRAYPNAADLLIKFNTGLAAIRANGIYMQILEEYQLSTEGQ